MVAHPEHSMPPGAGTSGGTFSMFAGHSFQPTWRGVPTRLGMRDDWACAIILMGGEVELK